uniref:Ig-like domain-containing protein n=1 Tax=Branchiostoma floridae TaxID=7739 RepID=C3YFY7_BRAFL|eukprot:XP_002604782.1 hypothetical protein BRAFLDRAFT_70634 [Branchiostoma floridae]
MAGQSLVSGLEGMADVFGFKSATNHSRTQRTQSPSMRSEDEFQRLSTSLSVKTEPCRPVQTLHFPVVVATKTISWLPFSPEVESTRRQAGLSSTRLIRGQSVGKVTVDWRLKQAYQREAKWRDAWSGNLSLTGLANNPFLIYCVVTSDGGEVPSTNWLFNSVIVPNQGDRTTSTMNGLIIQNLVLSDAGDWVCTGELSNGFTDTVTVRVIVDDFPGPPLNVALETPTTSNVLVTFDRPEGSEPLILTQWIIEYRASGDDAWTTVTETDTGRYSPTSDLRERNKANKAGLQAIHKSHFSLTDVTEFPIAGLVLQETYTFRVAAETGAGRGDYSQEVSITITEVTTSPPTTTPPNPPQQTFTPPPSTAPASLANNTETSPTIGQQSGDPQPVLNSILTIVLGLLAALIVLVLAGVGVYVWCKRSRRRVVCQTQDTAAKPPPA